MYTDQKNGKGDKKQQAQAKSSGGGWGFGGFLKRMLPKMKNQAHLPDDKNPTVSKHVRSFSLIVCGPC